MRRVALALLTLTATGGLALVLSLSSPATVRTPAPWATVAFSRSETAGGGVYVSGGGRLRLVLPAASEPAWSPDGRRLAYLAPGAGGAADVFVADADGTNRGRLTDTPADETSPTWAPDGRRLAVERAGKIVVLRADGTELRTLAAGTEPAWSPGGKRIAYSAGGDLFAVAPGGGAPTPLTRSAGNELSPSWSPDARRLAYVSDEGGQTDLHILDVRTRQSRPLTADAAAEQSPAFTRDGKGVVYVSDLPGLEQLFSIPVSGGAATPIRSLELPAHPASRPATGTLELLPDFDQQAPSDLEVRRNGGRWLLWFTSAADNVGLGPFIVNGRRTAPDAMTANQRVRLSNGSLRSRPAVGIWRYNASSDHVHWHLLHFQRYELRRADGRALVRDRKSGFCIGDRYGVAPGRISNRTPRPVYRGFCNLYQPDADEVDAGTSVGFSDRYHSRLDGQNVDITAVAPGRYVLVNRANPSMAIHELRYENNASSVAIRITRPRGRPAVKILAVCPDSPRC